MANGKILGKGLSNEILNRLTAVEVLGVNAMCGAIEIVYKKDDAVGCVVMRYSIQPAPVGRYSFKISDEPLPDATFDAQDLIYDGTETIYTKEPHPLLNEIAYIHNTSFWVDYKENEDFQKITIAASDTQGVRAKYFLHFEVDMIDENVYFEIDKEEAYSWFETKALDIQKHTVISLNFNKNHITRWTITDSPREDGTMSRLHSPAYVETLKVKSNARIFLNKTKDSYCIEGIRFDLLSREHFEQFDENDKRAFLRFAANAVAFLNTLFINKTFQYAYTIEFESFKKYEEFIESFKNKGYEMEHLYDNSEQPRPSSLDIYRLFKGEEELKLSVWNDWTGDWYEVNLEYDKESKAKVERK